MAFRKPPDISKALLKVFKATDNQHISYMPSTSLTLKHNTNFKSDRERKTEKRDVYTGREKEKEMERERVL